LLVLGGLTAVLAVAGFGLKSRESERSSAAVA
jgi:hypothetical protein